MTLKLADIQEPFREMLACFEAFRRVGISPNDIFAGMQPGSGRRKTRAYLVAKQVELSFTVMCEDGQCPETPEAFSAAWIAAGEWWNTATEGEQMEIWSQSEVRTRIGSLIRAMRNKGFEVGSEALRKAPVPGLEVE